MKFGLGDKLIRRPWESANFTDAHAVYTICTNAFISFFLQSDNVLVNIEAADVNVCSEVL